MREVEVVGEIVEEVVRRSEGGIKEERGSEIGRGGRNALVLLVRHALWPFNKTSFPSNRE